MTRLLNTPHHVAPETRTHTLGRGALRSWTARHPERLCVQLGCIWLTIEGDAEDYWLSAGMSLSLPAARQIVAEAWPHAAIFSSIPITRLMHGTLPHTDVQNRAETDGTDRAGRRA